MPHVKKNSVIMADVERSVELGEVEEVLLREAVGITSVPVKANTPNSNCFETEHTNFRHKAPLWSAIADQSNESCEKIEESPEPETRTRDSAASGTRDRHDQTSTQTELEQIQTKRKIRRK